MFFARLLALACFLSPILFSQIGFALEPVEFERDIAPILLTRCVECHNDTDASGGLNLTSSATLKAGSDSGEVLSPSHLEESYLWERVADGDMPPEKQGKPQPLPDSEKALLKRWIESGAAWPENRKLDLFEKTTNVRGGRDWWSLRPVVKPNLPTLNQLPEDANSVDHFILAKLAEQNLEPAPLAEPKQLLRRLYYDLTGLPPTAETLEEFAQDPSLENYERHVDQLLASPRFGERWARYWLDLVRFAETSGYERDQVKEHIWKYRDYVINAINEDKPYNQFVLEQLAGDELSNRSEETVIATGFLRLGTWNDEPNDPGEYIYERLEDMVHVTSSAFLGLTIKCARCHDHKFDPIPQTDYYRMASTFWAGPIKPRDRKYIGGPTPEELGFDVCGWTDLGREVSDLHLLKKGDPKHPGPVVEPAHLSFLPELEKPFESPAESDKTSQRRLQLAEWITDPQNPLTPRVMVNRLWQHHFGDALVRSPNNFGFTGAQPTHPELLDWLAAELQEGNWKLKRLHKLLVMSRTYRQSSLHPQYAEYAEQDFANNYWWRANRRRLDAEAFRDSLVNAAGILDLTETGGESFKPDFPAEALEGLSKKGAAWTPSPQEEQNRRSLYIFSQRTLLDPFLSTFDFSDTTLPCAERDVTTVAPQALALLNNEFVHKQSTAMSRRILQEEPNETTTQIKLIWRYALGREPSPQELSIAEAHLQTQQERFLELQQQKDTEELELAYLPPLNDLALHLRADQGIELDNNGQVERWVDYSTAGHNAVQSEQAERPGYLSNAINGHPALDFSGEGQFLRLEGQILDNQRCTILAVVTDKNNGAHREIFSNWNGSAGNSVDSLFLGSTGSGTIRFSDDFNASGAYPASNVPFLVSAVNGKYDATIYLNGEQIGSKNAPLRTRNLKTEYVIGQQGNINGEFWSGQIAELIVYNRHLNPTELKQVHRYLLGRYQLEQLADPLSPEELALASLCHVLFNSNEFMYID